MTPPTIDEILRRDAERWQSPSPPPLDETFDRAIGHRRRTATVTWLAVAAVVLAVVAASVLIGLRYGGGHQRAAKPSPTPSPTSVGLPSGYKVEHNFPSVGLIEGAVLPGDDPRTVDIVVSGLSANAAQNWPPGTCGFYRPVATVLAQGAQVVRVRISGGILVPRGRIYSGSCGLSGPWLVLPVQLDGPLGSRTLRVGSSVTDVLPARPPVPSHLPAGFVADGVQHPDPANLRFVSSADYRNPAGDHVVIRIGPNDQLAHTGPRRNPVTIHSAPGWFTGGRKNQPLCLTFLTRSMAFNTVDEQVCLVGRPASAALQHELVRVARSLPPR